MFSVDLVDQEGERNDARRLLSETSIVFVFSHFYGGTVWSWSFLVVYRRFVRLLVIRLAGCYSIRFSIRAEGEHAERTFQDVVYNRFLC